MSIWAKIGGGLLVLAALGLVVWFYGGARYKAGRADERSAWNEVVVQAERDKLKAYQAGVASVQRADANYIETIREKVVPVTRTIIERAAAYAATSEGASVCLTPDRVGLLVSTRGTLFPAPAAGTPPGFAYSLRPDPVGAEPRRFYE